LTNSRRRLRRREKAAYCPLVKYALGVEVMWPALFSRREFLPAGRFTIDGEYTGATLASSEFVIFEVEDEGLFAGLERLVELL
jgi:hypothetical protein